MKPQTNRYFRKIFLGSFWLFITICHAADDQFPEKNVHRPFATYTSRENLRKLIPPEKISDDYLDTLKHVESYGYSFTPIIAAQCPSPWVCPGNKGEKWYIAKRSRRIDLTGLLEKINQALKSQNLDACSTVRIGDARVSFATGSTAEFRAPISFTKRWCAGDATGDIANGSGQISIRIVANQTPPTYTDIERIGTVNFTSSVNVLDVSSTILGLIDSDSFLGHLILDVEHFLGQAIHGDSIREGVEDAFKQIRTSGASESIAQAGNAVLAIARNLPVVLGERKHGTKGNYLYTPETFFACTVAVCYFQVTETLYIYHRRIQSDYNTLMCELIFIESLSHAQKIITATRGSSLWNIAKEAYCQGEMYLYILEKNPHLETSGRLNPGQKIILPPMYVYSAQGQKIIKNGESLWRRWQTNTDRYQWNDYNRKLSGSPNSNLIYPLQLDDASTLRLVEVKR